MDGTDFQYQYCQLFEHFRWLENGRDISGKNSGHYKIALRKNS